jgi:hypothetical protein
VGVEALARTARERPAIPRSLTGYIVEDWFEELRQRVSSN